MDAYEELKTSTFPDEELYPIIVPADARVTFGAPSEVIRRAFDRVCSVVPVKERIPGTSMVQVTAGENSVTLTATDGAQTLVVRVTGVRVARQGRVMVPGAKMKAIFGLAPEEYVVFSAFDVSSTVTSGRAVWTVSLPSDQRPPAMPELGGLTFSEIPRSELAKGLFTVKSALPGTGGRKSLEQIRVAAGSVTASDGYRLVRQRITGLDESLTFSIPKGSVDQFLGCLTGTKTDTVRLAVGQELVVVRSESEVLVIRESALDYPDLDKLLLAPALENDLAVTVHSPSLQDLIRRVRVLADAQHFSVSLKYEAGKETDEAGSIAVMARDTFGNVASESMFATSFETPKDTFEFTANHRFLMDLLLACPSSLVTFRAKKGTKTKSFPVLVKDDDSGFVAVLQQSYSK